MSAGRGDSHWPMERHDQSHCQAARRLWSNLGDGLLNLVEYSAYATHVGVKFYGRVSPLYGSNALSQADKEPNSYNPATLRESEAHES